MAAVEAWKGLAPAGRFLRIRAGIRSADPDSAVDWTPLLNANCCLGFHAWSRLPTAFPTCPVEKIGPVMTGDRVAFERWYAKHRSTFAWNRILDGYLPGPFSGR